MESSVVLPEPLGPGQRGHLAGAGTSSVDVVEEGAADDVGDVAELEGRSRPGLPGTIGSLSEGRETTSRSYVLGLDPHQRALRPLGGEVGGQVEDALGADHDVLRAVAALGADPAALHRDRAREGRGDLGLVGDDDDRGAEVVAERVDQLEDVVAVLVAELAGGLVGEQQLRRRSRPRRPARGAGAGRRTSSRRPGRPAARGPTRSSSSRVGERRRGARPARARAGRRRCSAGRWRRAAGCGSRPAAWC